MSTRSIIHTDGAPAAVGPYSQAIRVGDLVFTAGQIPLRPDGSMVTGPVEEQTRQVLANLVAVLEAAGANADTVVKTTVFLHDMNDYAAVNAVYSDVFGSSLPARSAVQVARLPRDAAVEIEAIAAITAG